jgi:hypothetical protein
LYELEASIFKEEHLNVKKSDASFNGTGHFRARRIRSLLK